MNIDTFIEIGSQHKVCEDYIISGNDPMPYIILADGCSSSNNTEMGARILCYLAKQYLKNKSSQHLSILGYHDHNDMGAWIIHNAEMAARLLGLSLPSLDATLIIAYQHENYIRVHMYGDGCIFTRFRNSDTTELLTVEYAQNAPYYLTYLTDSERRHLYSEMEIDKYVHIDNSKSEEQITNHVANHGESLYSYNIDSYSLVLIASDGIESFIKPEGNYIQRISPRYIIEPCIAFKSTKGEFLKRRMNKQMKIFDVANIHHYDDLSVGVFIQED